MPLLLALAVLVNSEKSVHKVLVHSSLVPRREVEIAARESGVYVHGPSEMRIGLIVQRLNRWYERNGYVLARVSTKAQLSPGGELILDTVEPRVSMNPVLIDFFSPQTATDRQQSTQVAKETMGKKAGPLRALGAEVFLLAQIAPVPLMRLRKDAPVRMQDALLQARRAGVRESTIRAAETRLAAVRRAHGISSPMPLDRAATAGTLVRVDGVTRSQTVSNALGLTPGAPFRFNERSYQRLLASDLFDTATARASLVRGAHVSKDSRATAQLHMQVIERGASEGRAARSRKLEPALTFSKGLHVFIQSCT